MMYYPIPITFPEPTPHYITSKPTHNHSKLAISFF